MITRQLSTMRGCSKRQPLASERKGGAMLVQPRPQHRGLVRASAELARSDDRSLQVADSSESTLQRRHALLAAAAIAAAGATAGPAAAEAPSAAAAPASDSATTSAPAPSSSSSSLSYTPFVDADYELLYPSSYTYYETPIQVVERGPQPERPPVRARFESPGGGVAVAIIVKRAASIARTVLQVGDVSQLGTLEEAAKVLTPPGCRLLGSAAIAEPRPPRETPLGATEIPPRNYYLYEFTTPAGLHVALSAAAQRGQIYVCGVTASTSAAWEAEKGAAARIVKSFRLRDGTSA